MRAPRSSLLRGRLAPSGTIGVVTPDRRPPPTASAALFERARAVTPGGVNSPVRAFNAVGGTPRFIRSARGAWLTDVDGNEYVDLICSWGPMLLGHAHPEVQAAVADAVARGTSYGTPTEPEVELAEEIVARTPVERVRFVSSGTEATMSAIRLARGFTGRDVVVKFAGCYHGHVDSLLASAGSGLATFAVPGTPGVPESSTALTLVLPYNDRAAVEKAFAEHGDRIACLITEAAPGNMGVVPPEPGFNAFLAETCTRHGALFVSDEVMTGFRASRLGQWGLDGAHRGLAPRPGDVRQGDGRRLPRRGVRRPRGRDVAAGARGAGLPGRHPVREPDRDHRRADHAAAGHRRGLRPHHRRRRDDQGRRRRPRSTEAGVPHVVQSTGTMFSVFFTEPGPVRDFADASRTDAGAYAAFFHAMLDRRRLPAAVGVRGVVPVLRPRRPRGPDRARRPARRRPSRGRRHRREQPMSQTPDTIVHLLRHGEVHNPEGVLYGRRDGFHLSDARRRRWRRRSPTRSRTATSPTSAPRRSSGRRRPRSRWPRPAASRSSRDPRVIESTNVFEGKRFGVGDGALRKPSHVAAPVEPVQAVVGRALQGGRGPDDGRGARRPRGRRGPRGRDRLPPAADLDRPACTWRSAPSSTTRAGASARSARSPRSTSSATGSPRSPTPSPPAT